MSKYCTKCGKELLPGNSFCVNCGNKLSEVRSEAVKTTIGSDEKNKKHKGTSLLVITVLLVCVVLYEDTKRMAVCGNGVDEIGEQCDDGNVNSGDGCDWDCKIRALNPCRDLKISDLSISDDGYETYRGGFSPEGSTKRPPKGQIRVYGSIKNNSSLCYATGMAIEVTFFSENIIDTQEFDLADSPINSRWPMPYVLAPNKTLNFDRNIALSSYLIEESAMRQTLRPDATVSISIGSARWNEEGIPLR